ncbi:MAG: type II toxin-antitoxin system RelE/ParE family toxin [Sodalinema sp.]|jgi:mRNA interferase RelE/StbE|uniref:type II toxin-antitoxin system RelE family toxin n=1 Tax=Sodalinema sp. TaxID=3080550 RepID=UPI000B3FB0E4
MGYTVRYDPQAVSDLESIPRTICQRIVKKINWMVENFEAIQPLPLSANLLGFYKLRVGDYRVIYECDRAHEVVIIARVGHRRDIYEKSG